MPDFENHEKFVEQNPYKRLYFIKNSRKLLETFYIKDENSIG